MGSEQMQTSWKPRENCCEKGLARRGAGKRGQPGANHPLLQTAAEIPVSRDSKSQLAAAAAERDRSGSGRYFQMRFFAWCAVALLAGVTAARAGEGKLSPQHAKK